MLPTDGQNRTIVATIDALIEALRLDDEQLNTKVAVALQGFGPNIAPCLVQAAVTRQDCAGHCRRLLEVVEQIGGPGHTVGWHGITSLRNHRNRAVRETAHRIFDPPRAWPNQRSADVRARYGCHNQVVGQSNQMVIHPQEDPLAQGTPTTPAFEQMPEFLDHEPGQQGDM